MLDGVATVPQWLPAPDRVSLALAPFCTLFRVAPCLRRRDRRSMRRRSGQVGYLVKKGRMFHVRYYEDVPNGERRRRSVPVGLAVGKEKLSRPEALRKAADIVAASGVNTPEHLAQAVAPPKVETFAERVEWCRKYHKAWTDGKPGSVESMESQLSRHIIPRLGKLPVTDISDRTIQEFVADLKRTTFERRRRDGTIVKRYKLVARKTVLLIVGVVKLVVGRKVWRDWELDLGRPARPKQRFFTEDQLRQIIEEAPAEYRTLFALLGGTGLRIGEALGLKVEDVDTGNGVISVRRSIWRGQELTPKTENGERDVDIDPMLGAMLKEHIGDRTGWLFPARNGSPLAAGNLRRRVLAPLLERLGIEKAGMHAFRHARVTMLRRHGAPEDLQLAWIGHSALRTTRGYSHVKEDGEFRRSIAGSMGLNRLLGPNVGDSDPSRPAEVDPAKTEDSVG